MMEDKVIKLPDRPSDLIELAISDLEKVEKADDRYVVDMATWHTPIEYFSGVVGGKCLVCLAGSVMAQTLEADWTVEINPFEYDRETTNKLMALNHFRSGDVTCGLSSMRMLDEDARHLELDRRVTPYWSSRSAFKNEMLMLAQDLRAAGL